MSEEPEVLTFTDWLIDTGTEPKALELNPHHLRVLWDTFGEDYLAYCEGAELDFEEIG